MWVSGPLEFEGALICQSVRSAFDLALTAMALPRGSEVLTTALTIPDMVLVMEDHGLVAVPVDLEAARTPRTKVVLLAHLLGGRVDVAPVAAFARRHGLLLIEDVAQGFAGPQWLGHEEADVSLFSFGSIKTATALGGALAVVRDAALRAKMAAEQAQWPVQPVWHYAKKVARTLALHTVRDGRAYGVLAALCERTGHTLEQVLNAVTKGFPDAASMVAGIRRQSAGGDAAPEAPQVRRGAAAAKGGGGRAAVGGGGAAGGGSAAEGEEPLAVRGAGARPGRADFAPQRPRLRRHPRSDEPRRRAREAGHAPAHRVQALLEHIVFLPAWPELPASERHRLATEVR